MASVICNIISNQPPYHTPDDLDNKSSSELMAMLPDIIRQFGWTYATAVNLQKNEDASRVKHSIFKWGIDITSDSGNWGSQFALAEIDARNVSLKVAFDAKQYRSDGMLKYDVDSFADTYAKRWGIGQPLYKLIAEAPKNNIATFLKIVRAETQKLSQILPH